MKINETIIDNGIKLTLEQDSSIYGSIVYEDEFYKIRYWYKTAFQNEYNEDSMSEARVRLKNILIDAFNQSKIDENHNIIKFSDWEINI